MNHDLQTLVTPEQKNMLITLDCNQQVPSFVLHTPPIHTQTLELTLNDLSANSEIVAKHVKGVLSKMM